MDLGSCESGMMSMGRSVGGGPLVGFPGLCVGSLGDSVGGDEVPNCQIELVEEFLPGMESELQLLPLSSSHLQ